jgi:peptidoglycan/LPS O-acetylase OafA/YrhL
MSQQPGRYFPPIDFKTRFPALDGIRAFAILMVFMDHFGGGSHGGAVLRLVNIVRQRGWMGVDLFFVLSGFLITGILFDTRRDSKYFQRFFARRSLRILPVFYLVVVVLLLLTPVFQYQWHWGHLSFLVYIGNFFANANFGLYTVESANHHPTADAFIGHLWSLCVEEQFYLLWPILVWWIADRGRLLAAALGISALALGLRLAMVWYLPAPLAEQWIIRTLPFRMDSLLIGAVLALLLRGPAADAWQRAAKWFFVGGGALTLAIFFLSPAYDSPWLLTIGLTLIAISSAGLIGTTLRVGSPAFRLFSLKPLKVLGKYSYGFYIFHVLYGFAWIGFLVYLGQRLHSMALAGLIALPVNFIVTFLVAKLSFDLFESKFLRYKVHFEYDTELETHRHAFIEE